MNADRPTDSMRGIYRVSWWIVRGFFRFYLRLEARGVEHIPREGPVILASNHLSYLDPPVIGCLIPRVVNFLARDSLFRAPVFGPLLHLYQAVPVDRESGAAGLRAILDRLHQGGAIILFPEGTRSRDGRPLPAKPGVGMTVLKSEAPVVPVRVVGTFEAFGRHHWLPLPRKVVVHFGPADSFAAARTEAATCPKPRLKQLYQEVADALMARSGALGR